MPSALPIPSINDEITAAANALVGRKDQYADVHDGSVYQYLNGTAAMAFHQEAVRDRDLFRAVYTNTAQGDDLTTRVRNLFAVERILDTPGTGSAAFMRGTANAGGGIIWEGTRINIDGVFYEVAADTGMGASQLSASVPIRATKTGPGYSISNASGQLYDPLWDNSLVPTNVSCGNGTTFEAADDFRARVKSILFANRPGYAAYITSVLNAIGASQVVLLPSYYSGGVDVGINACYVGDSGFSATQALINACQVAAEGARVLGADTIFRGLSVSGLTIKLTVSLWDTPGKFDLVTMRRLITGGVAQYFGNVSNAFAYKIDGIRGAAQRVSNNIQDVTVITPSVDIVLSDTAWPNTLTRYIVNQGAIEVTFTGPN